MTAAIRSGESHGTGGGGWLTGVKKAGASRGGGGRLDPANGGEARSSGGHADLQQGCGGRNVQDGRRGDAGQSSWKRHLKRRRQKKRLVSPGPKQG